MNEILKILRGYGELANGLGFEAVVRHPLADETEWLEKLGLKPEDCNSCSIIWAFEERLIFVDLFSTSKTIRKSHVLYKLDDEARFGGDHFMVATEQFPLKTKHVEKMLRYLSVWLTDGSSEDLKIRTSKPIQISSKDICV